MTSLPALADALASDRFSRKTLADGSGVLLDVQSMRVLSLNTTGMFVLEEIAGGAATEKLVEDRLTEAFEVDTETAGRDLRELLVRLERHLLGPLTS